MPECVNVWYGLSLEKGEVGDRIRMMTHPLLQQVLGVTKEQLERRVTRAKISCWQFIGFPDYIQGAPASIGQGYKINFHFLLNNTAFS